jgi:hypothetical protein
MEAFCTKSNSSSVEPRVGGRPTLSAESADGRAGAAATGSRPITEAAERRRQLDFTLDQIEHFRFIHF